ncbi:MAG: hypothetical protein ACR2GT_07155 [Gaiellaceae bacterium]
MRENGESALVETWISRFETTIDGIAVDGERQRVAYEHWFDGASDRREGRRGRLAEAAPFVPPIVWLALALGGLLIVTYMCFYADRAEAAAIQALMMAGIATVVVAGMLIVRFLDRPYTNVGGSIKPTALTQVLVRMESAAVGPIPCDAGGRPRT